MSIKMRKIVISLMCVAVVLLVSGEAFAASGVFSSLAGKAGQFAEGFRNLAYAISGFGIVMFTFLAVCGKINFKHLGYIVICLFFLSGVGAFITYIKGGNSELTYKFNDTYIQAGKSVGKLSRHSSL